MKVIDQINGSAFFAQSAYSASIATKDNLGQDITATYITGVNLPESADWSETTDVVQTNSGKWNDITAYQHASAGYLTAHQSLEGYATQDWVTAQGYITGVDLSNYYTKNDTSSKSEINAALTSITPGDVGVNSYVQSNSATINEVNTTVNSNSSKWNVVTGINTTYYQGLDETVVTKINGYNLQAKVDQYGNVINTTYATKSQVNDLSGKVDEISAVAGGNVEVNTYVQNNSATINNVNTTYQTNSGTYLTAHQDISNKLDTNSFTAWSAAQAANAFKLSAGNGINLIDDSINKITRIDVTASEGDIGVNTYVRNNSAGINNAVSTYQSNSGTYLTAHQDISNKLDISTFTSWSAAQEASDYELSAGNGVTLYDDSVNKITRIDVTATGGDEEVNTLVHSNSSTWNDVTNKLDKSESANYYPKTGNPSKFIPQSALNLKINKISGIGGSALSVGNHNAVTFPLSDGFGGIDIGIPYDNGYLQYLCTDHISEVTLTTMPKVGNYKISANSAEYIIPGNSWITFYEQRNSEGQYRWTIKDYNGSGVLTSATSTTTGGGTGDMSTSLLEYNDNSQITGYNGTAFAGGGDVPTGTMNVSALEYNAVNEISGYNGSAIAQYGAEKQWLQHDDTIVHISNSAQYAFGCNISALQRLMGIDETVLFFAGNESSGVQSGNLTESIKNFKRIRVAGMDNDGHTDVKYIYPAWTKNADGFSTSGYEVMLYGANPYSPQNTIWEKWTRYSFSALTSFNVVLSYEGSYTANSVNNVTNNHKNSIREVVGIGRISG